MVLRHAEMSQKLWSTLPEQLIERVLSRLPFFTLVKMRCVCKAWNALILTGTCCPSNPNPKNVILCSTPGKLYLTSVPSRRILSLPFLYSARNDMELVATHGGLLCLRKAFTDDLMVCNPMTQCWKKLPSISDHRITKRGFWAVAGLLYEPHVGGSFKIVAAFFSKLGESCNHVLQCTKIYSSTADSWSLVLQDAPIVAGTVTLRKKNFHNKSFFHDKFLYVIKSEDNPVSGHVLLIFSMEKLSWVELNVEDFTINVRPAHLVCYRSQIYLVAEEEESAFGFGTIGVWKLDVRGGIAALWTSPEESSEIGRRPWVKVKTIYPGTLVSKNCKGGNFRWACLGMEDMFCFLVTQLNPGGLGRNPVTELVEYNLFSESWTQQWLAIHDVPDAEFCSFQPSIVAVADLRV